MAAEHGKQEHFSAFLAHFLPASGEDNSWEAIARHLRLPDGKTARNRAQTVAGYFKTALLDRLAARETGSDLGEQVRELLAILERSHD